jgi:tetratricopeptide (TPR) repeat protein
MPSDERRKLLVVLAAVGMLVAVALAYAPVRQAGLVWDDHALLERAAAWRTAPLSTLFVEPFWPASSLSDTPASYFRPLVLASYRFDRALGGTGVEYHFTNLALHLVCCALLATVAARLGARGGAAVLAALLWGLFPRLTEAVGWISGRGDVLAGVFSLAALALFPDARSHSRPEGARLWAQTLGAGACLFAALSSKEVALATATALAASALLPRADDDARAVRLRRMRLAAGVVLPVAVYLVLRTIALAGVAGAASGASLGARASLVLESVGRYAEMIVSPLRPQTSIGFTGDLDRARAMLGGVVIAAGIALAVVAWRRRVSRGVVVPAVLGVVALGLVSHVVPFHMSGAVTADRLLYVPLAGAALAAAVGARSLPHRATRITAAVVFAGAWIFARTTHARAADYADEVRFWVVAAERAHPHNTMAKNALAGVVRESHRPELACRLYRASRDVQESSGQRGSRIYDRTRENLAGCWAFVGRYEDAERLYEHIAEERAGSGRVQMGLGYVRLHRRDFDGAERAFARAAALDPGLSPLIGRRLDDVAEARAGEVRFASEEARTTQRSAYASHLTRLGRRRDAEALWLEIALDPEAPPQERRSALDVVVEFGDPRLVRRAVDACSHLPFVDFMDVWEALPPRERRVEQVERLLPRIEALATDRSASG